MSASLHQPDAAKRWLDEGAYVTFGTVDSAGRPHLNYVEVRGTATTTTDGAMKLIERLARMYVGRPHREVPGAVVRVTIRVTPERIVCGTASAG